MKRSSAGVRSIFWLATMFAIVFLVQAQSRDIRAITPGTKSAPPSAFSIKMASQP